jgi:hypothetical protein
MLQFAFGDQDIHATANQELLKVRENDWEFSQYYTEFHQWVPDVEWNGDTRLEVLRQGLSEELKDSLQHCDIPNDLMEFEKISSKCDSQIQVHAAKWKSRWWTAGSKKHTTMSDSTSATEAIPVGRMADNFGPAQMDLCPIKGWKTTLEE